jgi:PiT family inorganic phosphate transporter
LISGTLFALLVAVSANTVLLVAVVALALCFDFTNGFHDSANAMATSISTGALRPKAAVAMSAVLNFVGAFLSLSVAATIATGIVNAGAVTLPIVFAGLLGAIAWNLLTWYFGLPSSSSHALIGGIVGATLIAAGANAVNFHTIIQKVLIPAVLAPLVAGLIATIGTYAAYRITARSDEEVTRRGFRYGQIGTAGLVSLAHGTNDAQKTMGLITLALIAGGSISASASTPVWVVAACALSISAGTYLGGWRIIRSLGRGLVDIHPPQGFAAEASSAAIILTSSHFGYPLSTTQVCTGSIIGSGVGKRLARVRWSLAGRMAFAWLLTLPAAAGVGAGMWGLANVIGGNAGIIITGVVGVAFAVAIYAAAKRQPITADNVNEEWTDGLIPASDKQPVSA